MILLDAARADRFSSYGYSRETTPNMDRIAREGVVFENHFAQATDTRDSLPTLLFSRYFTLPIFPHSRNVPLTAPKVLFLRPDDETISLPRALSRAGLHTVAISTHPWLRQTTRFAREFDELHELPYSLGVRGYPSAAQAIDFTLEWYEANRQRNFFLYLHLMDTHYPHAFGPEAQAFFGDGIPPVEGFDAKGVPRDWRERALDETERRYLDALYDGSLRYTDRELGRLFEAVDASATGKETLLVITSDHGERLAEDPGRFGHGGRDWFETVARIPLILRFGGTLEPGRVRGLTEGVDVHPTLVALLGVELPRDRTVDGKNLVPVIRGEEPGKEFVFKSGAIRGKRYKAIFHRRDSMLLRDATPPRNPKMGALYDLETDPEERQNLWTARPEIGDDLLVRYREAMRLYFDRFEASVSHDQPESAFAVSAQNFRFRPGNTIPQSAQPDCQSGPADPGWLRSNHYSGYFLQARPGAPPIDVRFRIPNGTYRLTAATLGNGNLHVEGTERSLESGAWEIDRYLKAKPQPAGYVTVEGKSFAVRLEPKPGECFLVRYFGFEPVVKGEEIRAIDRAREERLRTLGYIE